MERKMPQTGEFVVCRITKINPYSVFAMLLEYGTEGMIHISEISSGWVKDIRSHAKVGQIAIAKVMRSGEGGIALSLKRVDRRRQKDKMKEYNLGKKAEKMLALAAKKLDTTLEKAYSEVGYSLQEKYGSLYQAFVAAKKGRLECDKKWLAAITEIAEKGIEQKEFEFKAELIIKTFKSDGIDIIKGMLLSAEKAGFEVRYIAAPRYMVKWKTKDARRDEKVFRQILEKITKSPGAEAEFKIIER